MYRITAQLLLITIATRYVKCLALALTSGTLVWQEIMTTSPISDLLLGENYLYIKKILSEICYFLEKKSSKKGIYIKKKSPKTTTIAYIPKGA
jgi:hypothetical protein